ncbi:MAG: DegQ family serine endoprotease [Pseudomonadota bacterium]
MKKRALVCVFAAMLGMPWIAFCLSGQALAQTRLAPESKEQIQISFAPVVKKAAPAVVNIYTRKIVEGQGLPFFDDPFFQRFFGEGQGPRRKREQSSLGSGVIVRPDGLIMTSNHVIADSREVIVALADRREFPAEIVMADKRTDLAVLRIKTGNEALPYLEMGDSDDLEVGDLVLAIGNPFGVGQTVTNGIVSALARTTVGVTDYHFFIQTDAAINPGNSGGALVTLDGRLIGINSAIYSRTGSSIGIGFAVPTNMARTVLHAAEGGGLVRPWLGASGQAVTRELANSLGLDRPVGVLVNAVYPGGPADRAGVKVGDVITRIEGHEIYDLETLRYRIATMTPNAKIDVSIVRTRRNQELTTTLMPPPEDPPRNETQLDGAHPFAGAKAANLSPALAEELGVDGMRPGVVVLEIVRGSPANRIGLEVGDVVLKINDQDIKLVKNLMDSLAKPTTTWRITLRRGEDVFTTTLQQR